MQSVEVGPSGRQVGYWAIALKGEIETQVLPLSLILRHREMSSVAQLHTTHHDPDTLPRHRPSGNGDQLTEERNL